MSESGHIGNKVVVIAGANGRLGRVLVPRFCEAGAKLAALVERPEETQDVPFPSGAKRWAQALDASDDVQVEAVFEKIKSDFGSIYAVINVIGMWESRPFAKTALEDWDLVMRVNLTTTFLLFREGLKYMDGAGRLLAMASGQGMKGGVAGQAAYAASKAGVMRLVESIADEYKNTSVTAHAIAPSMIMFGEADTGQGVPAGQIADLALYLCGPSGSAHNGATIPAFGSGM